MAKRTALLAFFGGTVACAAAYASAFLPCDPPAWAPWALGTGTATVMVAASALGAARPGRGVGRLKIPFALVFLILAGGFAAILSMPAADPADPALFLGLPAGAAVVLLGIGLLPLLVLPVAYALTFEETTLDEEDLARVRQAGVEFRAAHAAAATTPPPAPAAELEAV
jgi:hypothetical protein